MYHDVIEKVCLAISDNSIDKAKATIKNEYPFVALENAGRKYTDFQKTKIFIRDGFVDRYSGDKLLFPPVLRVLSIIMPSEFLFHKNWKMSECHIAYWQLLPTVDHMIPISRGGADDESNWVCSSQLRNSAKSNWMLEDLGWELHPQGDINVWDGQIKWFVDYVNSNLGILDDNYIKSWYKAAIKALK